MHANQKLKKGRRFKISLLIIAMIFAIYFCVSVYGYIKPLPEQLSYEGEVHAVSDVKFLYDLTSERDGVVHHEQMIFDYMYKMIEKAEEFIVLDMFLFNDEYDRTMEFPALSQTLTEALIQKKQADPTVDIIFITDRINTFYGSYDSTMATQLEEYGISVIFTDMKKMRDSNPVYSGGWRTFVQWFGTSSGGWLPNAFSPDSPDVTLRSYLELLNFKANHRKVIVTEKEGLITSANPHDGSAKHSNIAFAFQGPILQEIVASEKAVALMSGADPQLFDEFRVENQGGGEERYQLQLLTEGKIKKHLLEEIRSTGVDERVTVGTFYLSDRHIISELIDAANRGVEVRLILDANKDAFGREKNGIPNRPVANELVQKTNGNLEVRWYKTSGEQYHTKMALIEKQNVDVVIAGSSNFTKRNLDDFNLETDIKITSKSGVGISEEVKKYFDLLWTDEDYTLDYQEYADDSLLNKMIYRFQEWSGISTF